MLLLELKRNFVMLLWKERSWKQIYGQSTLFFKYQKAVEADTDTECQTRK